MGCCNKKVEEIPVSRLRYAAGLVLLCAVEVAALGALAAAGLLRPHYRRVVPFYVEYAREVTRSVLRRERILVGTPPACPCEVGR